MPSWLMQPGTVIIKRNVRRSKYEPLVDEVELVEANPRYAHVIFLMEERQLCQRNR